MIEICKACLNVLYAVPLNKYSSSVFVINSPCRMVRGLQCSVLTVDRLMSFLVSCVFLADTHPNESLVLFDYPLPFFFHWFTARPLQIEPWVVVYMFQLPSAAAAAGSPKVFNYVGGLTSFCFLGKQSFLQYSSDCGFWQTIVLWFVRFGLWLLPDWEGRPPSASPTQPTPYWSLHVWKKDGGSLAPQSGHFPHMNFWSFVKHAWFVDLCRCPSRVLVDRPLCEFGFELFKTFGWLRIMQFIYIWPSLNAIIM